jgi:hypothetical protein
MNLRAGVRDTNSGAFSPRATFGFWPVFSARYVTSIGARGLRKLLSKHLPQSYANRPDFRRFEQEIRYFNHGSGPAAN